MEVRRIGQLHNALPVCKGKKAKKYNMYRVPKFLEKVFLNLSCRTNLSVSTIMSMYLLIQALEYAGDNDPT
jgi:hypothetical protein